MNWIPIALLILRHLMMLFEALVNPDKVYMTVKTADGKYVTLPCNVERIKGKNRDKAKITADFTSLGVPITYAIITVRGRPFAKAHFTNGSMLYKAGPVVLGETF